MFQTTALSLSSLCLEEDFAASTMSRRAQRSIAPEADEGLRPLAIIFTDEGGLFEKNVAEIYRVGNRFVRLPETENYTRDYKAATYLETTPALLAVLRKVECDGWDALRIYQFDPINPRGAEAPASAEDIAALKKTIETQEWCKLKAYKARGRVV